MFQSPRSGKFESNQNKIQQKQKDTKFQSPRSGKFESNAKAGSELSCFDIERFNPLDRGNLNQILSEEEAIKCADQEVSIP